MKLELVFGYDRKEDVKTLFNEYTQMLIEGDLLFAEYLALQSYDHELENLEDKYGLPHGRLYLAYLDGALAGCVALKPIDEWGCELKRLYVRPEYRKTGLGKYLAKKIIDDAREIGYGSILLDTLPFLNAAIELYKKLGFDEIPRWNNSPMDTSIYMKLDL